MSFIKYADTSRADLVRLYVFLAQYDESVAAKAIDTIIKGIDYIGEHPSSGTPISDRQHVRKSVIDFGATGYLVFHKRYEKSDTNFVARIIHQKEWYDEAVIGLVEEKAEDVKTQGMIEP
ncbi:MAG: type II toxin-antitoxin system RelE/ParE family toxin [Gallionella sp.]